MGARGLLALLQGGMAMLRLTMAGIVSAVAKAVVSGPPFMYNIAADNAIAQQTLWSAPLL